MEENNKTLETEREFYFNKLQYIEEIITKNGLDRYEHGKALLDVMYAAEEDTVMVGNEGQVEIVASDGQRKTYDLKASEAAALTEDQPMQEEQPLADEDDN